MNSIPRRIPPAIPPSEIAHCFCDRCGRPHVSAIGDGVSACSQGCGCATSFSNDGSRGRAYYGSERDNNRFHARPEAAQELARARSVCDACISELELRGALLDLGGPVEFGADSPPPGTYSKALSLARKSLLEDLTWMAQRAKSGKSEA